MAERLYHVLSYGILPYCTTLFAVYGCTGYTHVSKYPGRYLDAQIHSYLHVCVPALLHTHARANARAHTRAHPDTPIHPCASSSTHPSACVPNRTHGTRKQSSPGQKRVRFIRGSPPLLGGGRPAAAESRGPRTAARRKDHPSICLPLTLPPTVAPPPASDDEARSVM